MEEIWKDIPEYEGLYQVSNFGRVKSLPRKGQGNKLKNRIIGLILSPSKGQSGYYGVCFMKDKKQKRFEIHRLVSICFLDNPENKPCVNHIDADKTNNYLSNLEWCTYKENSIHSIVNNLRNTSRGSNRPNANFNDNDVIDIKIRLKNGESQRSIARYYTVNSCIIQNINSGRTWKHIQIQ